MNQISIISEPMSNEKAYQKAREHMENPAFALPIQLGPNVSVLSLGSIPAENPTLYHKTDILYPLDSSVEDYTPAFAIHWLKILTKAPLFSLQMGQFFVCDYPNAMNRKRISSLKRFRLLRRG